MLCCGCSKQVRLGWAQRSISCLPWCAVWPHQAGEPLWAQGSIPCLPGCAGVVTERADVLYGVDSVGNGRDLWGKQPYTDPVLWQVPAPDLNAALRAMLPTMPSNWKDDTPSNGARWHSTHSASASHPLSTGVGVVIAPAAAVVLG